jgi:hypothetical protein
MSLSLFAALFFTVALLVTTAYFLLGSVPLLLLKHDTPMDGKFVRGFFDVYYKAAFVSAGGTAISYAFAGRPLFAAGAAALVILAIFLRGKILGRMDAYRAQIPTGDAYAIPGFRKTHVTAILLNLGQLVAIVWSLIAASRPA